MLFLWRWLVLLAVLCMSDHGLAGALDPWATWAVAQPTTSKQVPPMALVARGAGTNTYYVLEVDPATGALPVSATFSSSDDHNYGTPGASTLRAAAMLGVGSTAVSNANPVPVSDAGGSLTVDAVDLDIRSLDDTFDFVRIGDGVDRVNVTAAGNLNVVESNFPATVDTNTGAASASTPRVVLATRHETVSTPLASQLSNGTTAVDYGSGASGTATLRTVLATRHETVSTPLAVQQSNGTTAVTYDSGASSSATPRVVLATRHEAVATPLAAQLSNGTAAVAYGAGAAGSTVLRVVQASDSPMQAGRAYADSVRNLYSSTNVTTGAWVQLIASTAATINSITVFDSCGGTLELGTGAGGAETRKMIIPPGGLDGVIPLAIPSGTRLAVKAISATCSSGELDITGFN